MRCWLKEAQSKLLVLNKTFRYAVCDDLIYGNGFDTPVMDFFKSSDIFLQPRYVFEVNIANMDKISNPEVAEVFENYPVLMRQKLMLLRQLILDTAKETEGVTQLEETLKWGEPSYLTKSGSTIRVDWKQSKPTQYAMYFHCKTKLIDVFKELYKGKFNFEGNRAIIFNEGDEIPIEELKHCIVLSLTYHKRKHLPMLGV